MAGTGGRREGAGRKAGTTNHAITLSRRELIRKTLDPLLVIYEHMKKAHEEQRSDDAVKYAKEILPYVHGKQKDADESGDQTTKITGVTFTIKPE